MRHVICRLKPALLICGVTLALAGGAPAFAAQGDCGQPLSSGGGPTATDALYVLRTGVGLASCEIEVCDIDGSCSISAGDALRTLLIATGQAIALECDACGATTTTSTTTTTDTSTTTSTVPEVAATWSDVRAIFNGAGCAVSGCHGSSPSGNLGNLTNENSGYTELLNEDVDCAGSFFESRVVPFEPEESFLVAKLQGFHDCGSPMPLVGSLSQDDIQAIRSWILDGAPKN